MNMLKLTVVAMISLGSISGMVQANSVDGRDKFFEPQVSHKEQQANAETNLLLAANTVTENKRAETKQQPAESAGFVIAARGELTATNEAGEVRTLERRSTFYANETLKTGPGAMAQLRFKDRALMTLRSESELDIGEYHFGGEKDPENKSFLTLVSGGFRTISGAIGKASQSAYRIETPAASIGIRGTDYELVISMGGKVFAAVHDGGIKIVNDIGELDLGMDSDYLFAEVGEGQSPLGLTEMPEIFQVSAGQKKELTPEQKEKIAKKIEEGKEKAAALIANLGGEPPATDDGAIQKSRFEDLVQNDSSIDTRIDPDLLKQLQENGRYALLANGEEGVIGEFVQGSSIDYEGGKIVLGDGGELLQFSTGDNLSEGLNANPGIANVNWGSWDKADVLLAGGDTKVFEQRTYWMDAKVYDEVAVAQRTGIVNLELAGFTAGTSHPDASSIGQASGIGALNFDNKTIDGSIIMPLIDLTGPTEVTVGDLSVNFNGDMMVDGKLNNNFKSDAGFQVTNAGLGLPMDPISMSTGTQVKGTMVDTGGVPGFAGAFSAQLPTEVTGGVSVGVQGMFTMMGIEGAQRAAPAPFL